MNTQSPAPNRFVSFMPRLASLWVIIASASLSQAAVMVKTNNATALNVAGAWTNNAVPGVGDIAQWDATVSNVNNTTNVLGANLSWSGIKIVNPAGNVQISAGSTLTMGASGIDLTAANVNLSLSNAVAIAPGALQQWNVASGEVLSVLAIPNKPGQPSSNTGVLQVGPAGTVQLGAVASSIIMDNQNNPWVTFGLNDWAALGASGDVMAAAYTEASGGTFSGNLDVDTSVSASGPTLTSVRFNQATPCTLTISGTSTATLRGILVTANSGGGVIAGSTAYIRPNRVTVANTAFNVIQNSPSDFTIFANIANGSSGAATHLVKSGPGNLIISTTGYGSGGTDINGGTLTAAAGASLGGGVVSINNSGRLVLNASNTTSVASVTVNAGATNSINVNTIGAQQYIASLTFSNGSTCCVFNYANGIAPSTVIAPLLLSNLVAYSTVTIDVFSGSLTTGAYPLIKYTNSLAGTGFGAFALGILPPHVFGYLSNDTVNAAISLVITNVTQPLRWAVGNGNWDINTSSNWIDTLGGSTAYQEVSGFGDGVIFEDAVSGSSPIAVSLNTTVQPLGVTVTNNFTSYTLIGSGGISGIGGLTKTGVGTLALDTANSFGGGLNLNGGVTVFSALTNLGAGPVNFSGGTLEYNGNADDISVRAVSFGAGGATIDTASQSINLANPVGGGGAGGLTKAGAGTLTLNGTNKYSGNTIVAAGTLALGGNTYISNSAAIIVASGAVLDAGSSGVGLSFKGSPVQTLAGAGTVDGTVISSNGVITPGTNGVAGMLTFGNDLTIAGGVVFLDLSTNIARSDLIAVGGNLSLYGGTLQLNVAGTLTNGIYKLITYAGSLLSGANSSANLLLAGYAQAGKILALTDTTNANEIDLLVTSQAAVNLVWQGDGGNNYWDVGSSADFTNSSGTATTFLQGDNTTFNDTSANPTINLNASLQPGSVTVTANANNYLFADGTGTGAGKLSGAVGLVKNGSSTLTIATDNLNTGATVINAGTVQVGNGGTMGDLGSGNILNNGALVFDQADDHAVSGAISGTGSLTQEGGGLVTLAANNTYSGVTTISSGTLQIGNGAMAGTLGTNLVTDNGALTFNRSDSLWVANLISGTGSVSVNSGTVTLSANNSYSGGTIVNAGGKLLVGSPAAIPAYNLAVQANGTNDLNGNNLTVLSLNSTVNSGGRMVNNAGTTTNVLNINYDGSSSADSSIVIADNDGSGGKIALVKTGAGTQTLRGGSTYTGGTIISNGTLQAISSTAFGAGTVVLRGGNVQVYASPTIANAFQADTNATILTGSSAGNAIFTGNFTTASNLTFNLSASANQTWTFNGSSTQFAGVSGTIYVTGGSTTFFRFEGSLGSASATFDLSGGAVNLNSLAAATYQLGALSDVNGSSTLRAASGSTWAVGANNLDTTYDGSLGTSTGSGNSLVKQGSGKLTLGGVNNFSGTLTVSNGVLAMVDPSSCDSNSAVVLAANTAVLDVSGLSDGSLNLGNSQAQTFSGFGTLHGSLNEAANSTVNVGLGILTVTSAATLNGGLVMQLNRTNAINASKLVAASLVNASALTVTNVGPALQGGDTFQLFSSSVTGFTVTNLPALTGSLYWTNELAVNGSLAVINPINTNRPVMRFALSGNVLSLSWPTNAGWTLQQQTNSLSAGLGTNWVDVAGSASITATNITVDSTQPAIFYRLRM